MARGNVFATDTDRMPVDQRGPLSHQCHAGIAEQAPVDIIEAGDFAILGRTQGLPVERPDADGPAVAGGGVEFLMHMRGI